MQNSTHIAIDGCHPETDDLDHGSTGNGLLIAMHVTIVTSVVAHCYFVHRGFIKSGIYAMVLRQSLYSESLMIVLIVEQAEKQVSNVSAFAHICLFILVLISTRYRLSKLHRNLLLGGRTSYTIRVTSMHLYFVPVLGVVAFAYSWFIMPLPSGVHMSFVFTFVFSGVFLMIVGVCFDSKRKKVASLTIRSNRKNSKDVRPLAFSNDTGKTSKPNFNLP